MGRIPSAANVCWDLIVRNYKLEWKALKAKKGKDKHEVPMVTGTMVMKWNEPFVDYLHQCVGARNIPLAYVIQKDAAVCSLPATGN